MRVLFHVPLLATTSLSHLAGAILWAGLGGMTVALIALLITRWGHSRPLRKCVALSVWAHVLLAIYAMTIDVAKPPLPRRLQFMRVSTSTEASDPSEAISEREARPWEQLTAELPERIEPQPAPPDEPQPIEKPDTPAPTQVELPLPAPTSAVADSAPQPSKRERSEPAALDQPAPPPLAAPPRLAEAPNTNTGEVHSARVDQPRGVPQPAPLDAPPPPQIQIPPPLSAPLVGAPSVAAGHRMPAMYELRTSPQKSAVAQSRGGSAETEAAVRNALAWLAANQSRDGRWDASQFGAGREGQTLGQDRRGAGAEADTGMTGLALLAFLGAGYTHVNGTYQQAVGRGLEFLMRSQAANGHLAGAAEPYAFMYCHGMSALALSEAYAMTGDDRLRFYVQRAIDYTLSAQHRTTGGWRYRPGDTGDTSQLGWQLMALKSAELAGIRVPHESRDRAARFVASVTLGEHHGLASYRPGELPSRTMTAEALVCRVFLGQSRSHHADDEAANYLLGELPDGGEPNVYYWYYATLALYQLQDRHWEPWNSALTKRLTTTQHTKGPLTGSWDPDPVWGNYGGRVYATALSALCLEVYYRYLPLYVEAAELVRPIR